MRSDRRPMISPGTAASELHAMPVVASPIRFSKLITAAEQP